MWTSPWKHTQAFTQNQTVRTLSAGWCMGFTFRHLGKERDIFFPSANSCFRQNNKRLNDIVSCPLWLRSANGTTSLRQRLQKGPSLSLARALSYASTETLADLKDKLISIESCWSVLKCQSIYTLGERAWWGRSKKQTENKLRRHLGWTNTHKAASTVKCTRTRLSPHHVKSLADFPVCLW